MKYEYTPKDSIHIEKIANAVRDLFPHRVDALGLRWDVEGIIDDLNLRIIPRPWNDSFGVEAYVARDPKVLVVREGLYSNPRRLRFTLAEELSHKILEYKLWETKELPSGSGAKELTPSQYRLIEKDAKALAAEILMPKQSFTDKFRGHSRMLIASCPTTSNGARKWLLSCVQDMLAGDFEVSILSVGVRMRDLKLITKVEYNKYLGPSL